MGSPEKTPGYHDSPGRHMNNFNMGSRYPMQIEDTPGPGHYDPDRADSLVREKSPDTRIHPDPDNENLDISTRQDQPSTKGSFKKPKTAKKTPVERPPFNFST